MQWIEGRLGAARTIAKDLATYPVGHAAKQIGWISRALELDAATVTFEVIAAYRSSRIAEPFVSGPTSRSQPTLVTAPAHPLVR